LGVKKTSSRRNNVVLGGWHGWLFGGGGNTRCIVREGGSSRSDLGEEQKREFSKQRNSGANRIASKMFKRKGASIGLYKNLIDCSFRKRLNPGGRVI